jgi:predicted GNAT family acetyltransferase
MANDDSVRAVKRNDSKGVFEMETPDGTAYLRFRVAGKSIYLIHTEVPVELEGRGLGGRLVRSALDDARERGLTVIPNCPFVQTYLKRHPGDLDIVQPSYRKKLEQ